MMILVKKQIIHVKNTFWEDNSYVATTKNAVVPKSDPIFCENMTTIVPKILRKYILYSQEIMILITKMMKH